MRRETSRPCLARSSAKNVNVRDFRTDCAVYPHEVPCTERGLRCFRFDQSGFGGIRPREQRRLATYEYCTTCAIEERGGGIVEATLVNESKIGARIWVNGNEYVVEKMIEQLAMEAERGVATGGG